MIYFDFRVKYPLFSLKYTIVKLPTFYLRAAAGPAENRMIKEYQYTTALQAL